MIRKIVPRNDKKIQLNSLENIYIILKMSFTCLWFSTMLSVDSTL